MVAVMERWKGKVAVVTGASSGIGAAVAERLVVSGIKVVGIARRKDKMDELARRLILKTGKLYPFKCDVTKEDEVLQVFKWVEENLGPVHILINSAGIMWSNTLFTGDTKSWRETLETNVLSLCVTTREAVKSMAANNVAGQIVHVNCIVGHYVPPVPNLNIYPASKHAVTALTETLRQELNTIESKIKITSISPGNVKTDFAAAANGGKMSPEVAEYFKTAAALDAGDVTEAVLYVLSTPAHVQVHELTIKAVGEII